MASGGGLVILSGSSSPSSLTSSSAGSLAIVVLNQQSVTLARTLAAAIPHITIYGLIDRTTDVDVPFSDFGETVRALFTQGTAIVGLCAAGILIRTLAPVLTNKWQEPPVLAIAEDGSAVVPLLGGLKGVNDLARQIAALLNVTAAITTTGDIRFQTTLLAPPQGYHLANPDQAKTFIADLLAGKTLQVEGQAPWIETSKLPIDAVGELKIRVTERSVPLEENCLVYYPQTVAIGICRTVQSQQNDDDLLSSIQQLMTQAGIAAAAVAGIFALDHDAADLTLRTVAQQLHLPLRLFTPEQIPLSPAQSPSIAIALTATNQGIVMQESVLSDQSPYSIALAIAAAPIDPNTLGRSPGYLAIVGTGPGAAAWMSPEVKEILATTTDWVGYTTYLDLVEPWRKQQQRHESDNRVEIDRARAALDLAATGRSVAVISSGDPGIYAMAAAVFEVLEQEAKPAWDSIEIQVCPGISAMQAAAAQVGAPLGHDFCAISLSDILKPWETIAQRITAAAQADFVIAFYNPVSKQRTWQLVQAKEILLQWRSTETPVMIARKIGRANQSVIVTTLDRLQVKDVDMQTLVIVGSSKTRTVKQGDREWIYTPRRYD